MFKKYTCMLVGYKMSIRRHDREIIVQFDHILPNTGETSFAFFIRGYTLNLSMATLVYPRKIPKDRAKRTKRSHNRKTVGSCIAKLLEMKGIGLELGWKCLGMKEEWELSYK